MSQHFINGRQVAADQLPDAPSGSVEIELTLTVRVDNGRVVEVEDMDWIAGVSRTRVLGTLNSDRAFLNELTRPALREIEGAR
jgi:hypothetical protein